MTHILAHDHTRTHTSALARTHARTCTNMASQQSACLFVCLCLVCSFICISLFWHYAFKRRPHFPSSRCASLSQSLLVGICRKSLPLPSLPICSPPTAAAPPTPPPLVHDPRSLGVRIASEIRTPPTPDDLPVISVGGLQMPLCVSHPWRKFAQVVASDWATSRPSAKQLFSTRCVHFEICKIFRLLAVRTSYS